MTSPTSTNPQQDLDAAFDQAAQGGGGGAPSYAFPKVQERGKLVPEVGHVVQGEITDVFGTVVKDIDTGDPKLDKNGNTQPQVNITLSTEFRNWDAAINPGKDEEGNELSAADDEGQRRIYAKYRLLQAIAKAVRESGNTGAPKVGGKLAVRVKALIWDEKNPTRNPLPDYDAKYVPPAPKNSADDAFSGVQQDQAAREVAPEQGQSNAQAAQQVATQPAAAAATAPAAAATQSGDADPWTGAAPGGPSGW